MIIGLAIISLSLAIICLVIFLDVVKYIKKHSEEKLENHEKYIYSRLKLCACLSIICLVLNLVIVLIRV